MKAYKFKIRRPTQAIAAKFEQTLDLCRELYNSALRERIDAYKINNLSLNYQDQQNQLPEIKEAREDLNSVYSQVLQDALKRLDKTFKAFFNRVKTGEKAGFPRFRGFVMRVSLFRKLTARFGSKAIICIFPKSAKSKFTCRKRFLEG